MEIQVQSSIPEVRSLNVALLGKPIHAIRDKLENIITESCNKLASELQIWLNTHQIEVELETVELYWPKSSDIDKSSVTQFKHQAGGALLISLEHTMLVKLADRFYSATIERDEVTLTTSDLRLQERIGRQISQWVAPPNMWQTDECEIGSDVGLKALATVTYGGQTGQLTFVIDSYLIQTLMNQLDLRPTEDLVPQLHHSLKATPVCLTVLLSKKIMPLSDILSLAPNDILPIELLSTVPVKIGNEHLFSGRVYEQEGQLVLTLNPDKESQR